jgi:WD40 repeat protein
MAGEGSLNVTAVAIGEAHHFGSTTLRLTPGPHPTLDVQRRTGWGVFARLGDRVVLAMGGGDALAQVWDPVAGVPRHTLVGRTGDVEWLWGAFVHLVGGAHLFEWEVQGGQDPVVLATGDREGAVRVWDPATGALLRTLTGHTAAVRWGSFAQLGGRVVLATGGDDGTVRVWDPIRGSLVRALLGQAGGLVWGSFAQLGGQVVLATGGRDGDTRVWDPVTGGVLHTLTGHTDSVEWGTFAQLEGRMALASGGSNTRVRLWDPQAGTLLRTLTTDTDSGSWGWFAQLGGRVVLATGGDDGTVRVWDPATGALLRTLTGHTATVRWGSFAQLGDRVVLATGGDDGTVRVWNPATGALLRTLTGHTATVRWGSFAQLGDRVVLATGGDDGTVRVSELVDERSIPRLPAYRSDEARGADALDRLTEATALAELITSVSARPPLAVGLFGDWGEGKSYFLHLLQAQVRAAAARGGPIAHEHVRQVRFNAWHYAETDLWASLVAEIFRQLATPSGDDDPTLGEGSAVEREARQREQARLAAELVARRGTAERLAVARAYRDELRAATVRAKPPRWPGLSRAQQTDATRAASELAPDLVEQTAALYSAVARPAAWWRLRCLQLRQLRRSMSTARLLGLGLALVGIVAGVAGLVVAGSWLWHGAGVLVAALGASGLITLGWGVWVQAATVWKQIGKVRGWLERIGSAAARQTTTALEVADREVDALKRELQHLSAAGQLAGWVADRAATGDYRRSLGLMTQIREDFEQMAKLLAPAASFPASSTDPGEATSELADEGDSALGERLPQVERIVLYIDDLDRCPPDRVVAILEAIHLLLAVPLFVVVVAVDPRWLLRAISAHYRDLLHVAQPSISPHTGDDVDFDELAAGTPSQYLEKIFQIVMTLPPLRASGYSSLLDSLVGMRADEAPDASNTATQGQNGDVTVLDDTGPAAVRVGNVSDPGAPGSQLGDGPLSSSEPVQLAAPRRTERIDPLALTAEERGLLELLGPPLVRTPRSVKRLANSYGLFTALRRLRDEPADIDEELAAAADRAAMVLLASLIGFPARGPRLLTELRNSSGRSLDWRTFLDELAPISAHSAASDGQQRADVVGDWAAARLGGTAAEREWIAMIRALRLVTDRAHVTGLDLPDDLHLWRHWISDVGRLSFPAGPVAAAFETANYLEDATRRP